MSAGYMRSIYRLFGGLVVLFATTAQAGFIPRYYCQRSEGGKFTDFVLTVNGRNVTVQPYNAPESPGVRIYRGAVTKVYPSGNVLVNLTNYSQVTFLSPFPNMIFTASLFANDSIGYARVFVGKTPAQDAIMVCDNKKVFY